MLTCCTMYNGELQPTSTHFPNPNPDDSEIMKLTKPKPANLKGLGVCSSTCLSLQVMIQMRGIFTLVIENLSVRDIQKESSTLLLCN